MANKRFNQITRVVTSFDSNDVLPIGNGTLGDGKMPKDTLLKLTSQNALAGNVAPAFVPNETNAVINKFYIYQGELYKANENYSGDWDGTKFTKVSVDIVKADANLVYYSSVSSNSDFNKIVKEVFIPNNQNISGIFDVEIQKAMAYGSNFRSFIRFAYGNNQFIYLYYKVLPTQEESLADLSAICSYQNNLALVDWSLIDTGASKSFNLTLSLNVSDINFWPALRGFKNSSNLENVETQLTNVSEQVTSNTEQIEVNKNNIGVTSNKNEVNAFIKEIYIEDDYEPVSIEINRCYEQSPNSFRNMIRFRDANNVQRHALYSSGHLTPEIAEKYLNCCNSGDGIFVLVDWSKLSGTSVIYTSLNFPFKRKFDKNLLLATFYEIKNPLEPNVVKKVEYCDENILEASIGTSDVFPLPLPLDNNKVPQIFVNGIKKVPGADYEVNANHRFIKFNGETPAEINCHYPVFYKEISHSEPLNDLGLENGQTFSKPYASKFYRTQFGKFGFQTIQWAQMVTDPEYPENKVLAFVAKDRSDDGENVRVQIPISDIQHYYEMESSVEMYLPSEYGWSLLQDYSQHQFNFMTVNEQWGPLDNNTALNPGYRTSLNIKNASDNRLYFHLNCQDFIIIDGQHVSHQYNRQQGYNLSFDDSIDKRFPIPLDTWFTLKVYTKSGYNGWYKLEAIAENSSTIIYDGPIMGTCPFLYSQEFSETPFGVGYIAPTPLKMYFGDGTMRHLMENNQELRIYWKNLSYVGKDSISEL